MEHEKSKQPKTSEHIPGYEFIRKLGEGGMGIVFLARQKSMDRLVAVKILPMKLSKDKEFIDRFVREARLAGKFDHVNAVRGLDTGEHGGFYYFVMEYVEGQPLDKILSEQDMLTEERALRITMQIARALDYANKQGIIHRDVKPANIMVMKDDVAKLCDLGLAKYVDAESHLTLAGETMGTPHYASPEQVRGDKDIDTRADIYSLGATLYHLVTGQTPFSGTSAAVVLTKHLTEERPWPADVNPNVSKSCCRLIEKMMAKDPIDRYATPAELIKDMELVIDGKRITSAGLDAGKRSIARRGLVKPRSVKRHEQRPAKKSLGRAVGSLVAAAVILGVLIVSLARKEDQPPPEPAETAKPGEETAPEKMYEYAAKWFEDNPQEYKKAIEKYRMLSKHHKGTTWDLKARDAIAQIEKKREEEASSTFAKIQEKVQDLASSGDYDGAIAIYRKLPEKFTDILEPRAKEAVVSLKKEAEGKVGEALTAAEKHSKEGEPGAGLEEVEKVAAVKYAALADKVIAMRARLEDEKKNVGETARRRIEARAEKKIDEYWTRFDDKIMAGDYKGAKTVHAEVSNDEHVICSGKESSPWKTIEALGGLIVELDRGQEARTKAVERLSSLVGKEVNLETVKGTRKGRVRKIEDGVIHLRSEFVIDGAVSWAEDKVRIADLTEEESARLMPMPEPETPAGWLARAVEAMEKVKTAGGGKAGGTKSTVTLLEEVEAALLKAEGNALSAHYREKLNVLKLGEAEAYAKEVWREEIAPLARRKHDKASKEVMLAALDTYLKTYGKTKFAKSKDKEIEKLGSVAVRKLVETRRPVGRGPIIYTKWPFDKREAKLRQKETAKGLGLPVEKTIDLGDGVNLELMLIPAGEFMMGSKYSPEEIGRRGPGRNIIEYQREHPRHHVRITKPYYMGKYEVTQEVWQKVMGANPSKHRGERNPVDQVSWDDCQEFVKKLNALVGKKERFTFRLPTEAEWEHACRAGTETPFHFGETITADLANYAHRSPWDDGRISEPRRNKTMPVGSFEPNPWGLYDMVGNVVEWCEGGYRNYRRETRDIQIDPWMPMKAKRPTVAYRGGAYSHKPSMCRSAYRDETSPDRKKNCDGFRVTASPQ